MHIFIINYIKLLLLIEKPVLYNVSGVNPRDNCNQSYILLTLVMSND